VRAGGLPGEYVRRDAVHTIRFADAPTREEIEAARRGEPPHKIPRTPPSYDPYWLGDDAP
jgi:hypothetical protein